MGINAGAVLGQIMTGLLGEKVAWHFGFGAAGVGMLIGLWVFAVRSKRTLGNLGLEPTRHPDPVVQSRRERTIKISLAAGLAALTVVIVLAALRIIHLDPQVIGKYMTFVLVGIAVVYFGYIFVAGGLDGNEKKRVGVIFILFVFAAIFWGAFEQAPTSLNLFAKDFTRRTFFGWEVPAIWFQSINSVFIVLLAPFFAAMWQKFSSAGRPLSSPFRFAIALLFAAIGFGLMIPAANYLVSTNGLIKVSAMWLVMSYLFQTIGELCLSPVGLSSMTKLSPRRYVGQMMGIWFLASSVGNLVAGLVGGRVDPKSLGQTPVLFIGTTVALLAACLILLALTPFVRKLIPAEAA
jgi:POT family proton-dependent oligopeptide transporter